MRSWRGNGRLSVSACAGTDDIIVSIGRPRRGIGGRAGAIAARIGKDERTGGNELDRQCAESDALRRG